MRRRLMAIAAVACGSLALLGFARGGSDVAATTGPSAGAGHPTARGRPAATGSSTTKSPSPSSQELAIGPARTASTAVLRHGRELFISSCASCHGMQAKGKPGTAPSLRGVGEMAASFYLETGRMPLDYPRQQPTEERPAFDSVDIGALVSYIGTFGGPSIPSVDPSKGSVVRGQEAFALNCAGCHTIQGQGGMVTGSAVPSLNRATATQIGEALRIGPYLMPRFGPKEISEYEVNSIAAYVRTIQHPEDRGGWGIGRIGPIPEGMVTWLLAITAILLVARLLGERTPPRRSAG